MTTVLVGLGSNLGDSAYKLQAAADRLQNWLNAAVSRSALWQTTPVHCALDTPDFMNAVLSFTAPISLTPAALLAKLQSLEAAFGRPSQRLLNESRLLDLDLLAFGQLIMATESLILPHPRAHLRHFVLAPALEVAPNFIWPGTTKGISELLADLPESKWGERKSWPSEQ